MRRRTAVLLAAALLCAGSAAAQVPGADGRPLPSITVTGRARETVVPDVAVIAAGVAVERAKAADAAAETNRVAQRLMDTVKAAGIEPRDVITTAVELTALYSEPPVGKPRLTGYRGAVSLQVRVQPIDKAGALASALTDAGATSIDGIDFRVTPDAARTDRLKADATRQARHDAETYAGAIGLKLGRVLSIAPEEFAPVVPRPMVMRKRSEPSIMAAPAAPPVPLAAGTQDEAAAVVVTFEILQ